MTADQCRACPFAGCAGCEYRGGLITDALVARPAIDDYLRTSLRALLDDNEGERS